jgi:hypothetical protein
LTTRPALTSRQGTIRLASMGTTEATALRLLRVSGADRNFGLEGCF